MSNDLEISHMIDQEETLSVATGHPSIPAATVQALELADNARQEAIKLVQRLFVPANAIVPQVVVFAAVEPGTGCSWVCARTAEVLAAHGEGLICLLDANFRSPVLQRDSQSENDPLLSDKEWMYVETHRMVRPASRRPNLALLSYRPLNGDYQTSRSLGRFYERVSQLRRKFTHVLIDAPPINSCADATLLGRAADGLVMVVEANNTRRDSAKRAKDILTAAGVRVLGAVLNKRTFPIPDPIYRRL